MDLFDEKMKTRLAEALYDADARICLGPAGSWGVGNYETWARMMPTQYDMVTNITHDNHYERLAHVAMRFIQDKTDSG